MNIAIIIGPGSEIRLNYSAAMLAGALSNYTLSIYRNKGEVTSGESSHDLAFILVDQIDSEDWSSPTSYRKEIETLTSACAEKWSSAKLVLAGRAVRAFGPDMLKVIHQAHAAILGDTEGVAPDLLDPGKDWKEVPGLALRLDGRVCISPRRKSVELHKLSSPAWDLVAPCTEEIPCGVESSRLSRSAAGWQPESVYFSTRGVPLPVSEFLRRMKEAAEVGNGEVVILDPIFPVSKEYLVELSREILKSGARLSWSACFDLLHIDEESLTLAAAAGLTHAAFAPASFFVLPLRSLGAAWNCNDVWRVLDFAERVPGVKFSFQFFLAAPALSLRMLIPLLRFRRRWRNLPESKRGDFVLTCPRVFPGTALYRSMAEGGTMVEPSSLIDPNAPRSYFTSLTARLFSGL